MHVEIIPILGGGTFSTLWCLCLSLVEMSFFSHSGLLLRRRRRNSDLPLGSLKRSRRVFDYTLDVFMRCLCVCLDAYVESLLIIWQNYGQCQILLPSLSSNCPLLKSIK